MKRAGMKPCALGILLTFAAVGCGTSRAGDASPEGSKSPAAKHAPKGMSMPATGTLESNPVELDAPRNKNRHPEKLMEFLDIQPGARVVDIAAGDAYTSLYMAREVGAEGTVYAHNTPAWRGFLRPYVEARLANGPLANIEWIEAPFADPIPKTIRDVDLVTNVLTYHDTIYYPVDRDAMNRNIFAALRPGGRYVIVDHAAREQDAANVAKSLHRISEQFVIDEVQKAGFELDATASFLRYPDDNRTSLAWTTPQPRTDRFVIAFRKPER